MRCRKLLIFFLLFSYSSFGQQPKSIRGIVLKSHSGETLAGASILIYHSGGISGLVANKEGRFALAAENPIDSIRVSMVGYYSKTYKSPDIRGVDTLDIALEMAPAGLQEIVIRPVSALSVINKAIANIPVNQPAENFENTGFYREIIGDRDHYFSVAEAVFQSQYFPAAKNYKLKLIQGRSKQDVSYTRLFEDFHPGGGPQALAGNGFIPDIPDFLNSKETHKFHYKIDSIVSFDGKDLYHISFDQNEGVKEALDQGYVLIETERYGIAGYDVRNSPSGTPYIKSLRGTEKILASLMHIDLERKGWHTHVDFICLNNKWLMNHAETEYQISYKQPKKQLDLQLRVNIELAFSQLYQPVTNEIAAGEEWRRKNRVADLATIFDSAFWGNNNIISPTDQVTRIIAAISKSNNELSSDRQISGWQYLNRNLFVSYQGPDSVTMIPITKSNWKDEETGGLLFQIMDSNFIAETQISITRTKDGTGFPDRGFQQAGIMVRAAERPKENYVMLSLGTGGNSTPKIFLKSTRDGKSKTLVSSRDDMRGWLRIEKSGIKIVAFFKEEKEMGYKKIGEFDLDWLSGKVEAGLACFASFAGDGPKMKPDLKAVFSPISIRGK
jgi:hypothetical protein